MQRYAVNNGGVGGPSTRDVRAESSSLSSNFPLNPRRSLQPTPYKLRCEKESLNSRLGPPDFHPPTLNCPEETLTKEYVQAGYRETVEGLEEAREVSLTQVHNFTKPVINKCKEAVRKYHRAINESRAQKRKAGQVYGVPLSGNLLSKPGIFPEQKTCGEDLRKKWLEGLSQPHKRLRTLADHVPHNYRRKSPIEVLIRNNVPLLRATWFIKVSYLNQVRPGSSSILPDKIQFSRSEQWTRDVIEYLQYLVDEFVSRNTSHSNLHIRERSQGGYAGSLQHKTDSVQSLVDGEEPSLNFKWWYLVRIIQWHHAEGLLLPSLIIDWVLTQLQEKDLLGILQLLLPIIHGVIETVVQSQTCVRSLVKIAIHFIQEPSPSGSDLVDNSRRAYTISALVEMLRYLILAVPDTFVGLNCFPLPSCVVSNTVNDTGFLSKTVDESRKIKGHDIQGQSLSIVVSSIQKCAKKLARSATPGHPGRNMAKAVQTLDMALTLGDVREAYTCMFEDLCDGAVDEKWIADVSPCLRSSLRWIGAVSSSFVSSIFFVCEWATCDFRDFRSNPPHRLKFTGRRDFSQVYIAIRLFELKMRQMRSSVRCKSDITTGTIASGKGADEMNKLNGFHRKVRLSEIFQSPGSLHDSFVCWIDQHDTHSAEGFKRLQLLVIELTRAGIFYPQAYVRQLIVSGITDKIDSPSDLERRKRHHKILKQLPGPYIRDALEEAQITDSHVLTEAIRIYSNERHLLLRELLDKPKGKISANRSLQKHKGNQSSRMDSLSSPSIDQWKNLSLPSNSLSGKNVNRVTEIEELKASISTLLLFPKSCSTPAVNELDESKVSVKKSNESTGNRINMAEGTPGCEECRKSKRQKLTEEENIYFQGQSPNLFDEDIWWVRKGLKSLESSRPDPPVKQVKQATRGRQKLMRKTQSLAQLAAARIEGSQGASTSHVCESRVSCPHHRPGNDSDTSKPLDGKSANSVDIVSIGKSLKQLRLIEQKAITVWLISLVRQLVEETGKITETAVKVGQTGRSFPAIDEHGSAQWKLGEDELSAILYLMDVSNELVSAAKFLIWLLLMIPTTSINSTIHGGRNVMMVPRNAENRVCALGEAFVLSSLRRYENILVAADLIPEALSDLMHRAAALMASNGRVSGSASLVFARHLFKKYCNITSVVEWVKNFKVTFDKRLVSELESGRSADGEFGLPLGVPAGVEDFDEFLRQKISGVRVSRVGLSMRDIVQRQVDDAFHSFYGKERKLYAAGANQSPALEKLDDGYQIAQQIVVGLLDCMRQTGGAAQEGDPTLVSFAISAIVCSIGQVIAKIADLNSPSLQPASGLSFARYMLHIHLTCLWLLKDALGERQSRVFEISLATEASSALSQVFSPTKTSRGQFQPSPETHDSNANLSSDISNNSTKPILSRVSKITAAISALIVGAILLGISTLERMVSVFRLKEGLDVVQFVRSMRSNSNGSARSMGALKVDNTVEVSVHWFRVLVGNCRSVSDGFIVDLLGEPSIVALSRMQRLLSLSLVFPPAYSIFGYLIWRQFILNSGVVARDDIHQLYQSLNLAIGDALKHLPFRDICLRDSGNFYDLITSDATDSEFAAMLDSSSTDMHSKAMAFVPLRARLFLSAIIDCKMPPGIFTQDDGNRVQPVENGTKLQDKLVHILDTLQPAKFHWQWLELRLLLNEQAIIEKLEAHDTSFVEALRSLSPNHDKVAASEIESNFIEIILTRLLVRPDAAPLYSEVIHLLGRSLDDSMLLQARWLLAGPDVLFGRKSIRQRLINKSESKFFSAKAQFWKPWGWCLSNVDHSTNKGVKRKFEATSIEEGEVVDEGTDSKRHLKSSPQVLDVEAFIVSQQHVTEKALIELILPCIDHSSDDSRITFASDLIKQMNKIEQQINAITRGASKQPGTVSSGIEVPTTKGNSRKGMRGGSPGLARRPAAQVDTVLPSPSALRVSMSLRLQLLLRLLPVICADREPSGRNMRHMLASVLLRLLGSRVVYEDADQSNPILRLSLKREVQSMMETASAFVDLSGESLFDRLLLVLHGMLSSCQPCWLRFKSGSGSGSGSKSTAETSKDWPVFDREVAESLKNDLDRMVLPDAIRWRIQTAMPFLFPSIRCSISCHPPSVPALTLASLQPSIILVTGIHPGNSNVFQKSSISSLRSASNGPTKSKPLPLQQQELDMDIDPWTLLEDGAGSGPSSSNTAVIGGSDHANLRAASWLKGAVRVRRTDLTYIGAVDEDS